MTIIAIGKGIDIDVDFEAMPANAIEHILKIGARNVLMDAHANVTEKEHPDPLLRVEAARAMAQKKLDALMSGTVRVAGTRAPRGDTIETIVNKHARAAVLKWGNAKAKATLPGADDAARTKWVNDGFNGWMTAYKAAKADELRAIAEAELAAKAKLGSVDLDDLLA